MNATASASPINQHNVRLSNAGSLALAAVCIGAAIATSRSGDWEPWTLLAALAVFQGANDLVALRQQSAGRAPWVVNSSVALALSMTLLGPAPALLIGLVGLGVDFSRGRTPAVDQIANLGNYAFFIVSGSLLAQWAIEAFSLQPSDPGFAVLVAAVNVYCDLASFVVNAITGAMLYGEPIGSQARRLRAQLLACDCVSAMFAAVIAFAYGAFGIWALGLVAVVQILHQYLTQSLLTSEQRAEELAQLSESRGRLVGQVLQAEESERRRLAESLHDEALQNLLAARRGLADSRNGGVDRARTGIERTIEQLRGAIFNLHPDVLEHAGLRAALRALAEQQAELGGFEVEVDVDPAVEGSHDRLLFVLAREQLTNVGKHAGAARAAVVVGRSDDAVVMEVRDDGCGMDSWRRSLALEHGHIGLASSAERVEAMGGSFEVESRPGAGTRIRTVLPLGGAGSNGGGNNLRAASPP